MAEHVDAELRRAVREMQDFKRSMFKAFAGMVGQPNETDRARLIWAGLVQFANARFEAHSLGMGVALALRATIALCVQGNQELEDVQGSVFELEFFDDVDRIQEMRKISADDAFSTIALELLPQLRQLLAWIADPNRLSLTERRAALSFLLEHGEQELRTCDFDPNDEFDDTGNAGYPLFYWKRPRSFETVMAPIARFVFDRLEKYNEGELPLDRAIPIVLCKREGCGKFSLGRRKTRDFCSASCRTLHRQKEKPEEHAAYMRQYRKNNYTKPVPRRKGH